MKARELAELLMHMPEAEVMAYDADAEGMYPVTGTVLSPDQQVIELFTDEP